MKTAPAIYATDVMKMGTFPTGIFKTRKSPHSSTEDNIKIYINKTGCKVSQLFSRFRIHLNDQFVTPPGSLKAENYVIISVNMNSSKRLLYQRFTDFVSRETPAFQQTFYYFL